MFSQITQEEISNYVYCLINPVSGNVFYIGKGVRNRVFHHAMGEPEKDRNKEKIDLINTIKSEGKHVGHIILRYGLSEKEAYEVEAALIDFVGIENLANAIKGKHTARGLIACEELELKYAARPIEIRHDVMLIKINVKYEIGMTEVQVYNATKASWVASMARAEKVEYVLAIANGIVRGVFKPLQWYKYENESRIAFHGEPAPEAIKDAYLNRTIYVENANKGTNPIKYIFAKSGL